MKVLAFLNWRAWYIGVNFYGNGDFDVYLLPLTIRFYIPTEEPWA